MPDNARHGGDSKSLPRNIKNNGWAGKVEGGGVFGVSEVELESCVMGYWHRLGIYHKNKDTRKVGYII